MNPRLPPVLIFVPSEFPRLPTGSVLRAELTQNKRRVGDRNPPALTADPLRWRGGAGRGGENPSPALRKIAGAQNKLQGKTSRRLTH